MRVVIRSLTFKEGYTTDGKSNFGTSNKRFYYKLLNWELNWHVQFTSIDSSKNFMFLTSIIKPWTSNATNRRCYTINMHSSGYRDMYMFRKWEKFYLPYQWNFLDYNFLTALKHKISNIKIKEKWQNASLKILFFKNKSLKPILAKLKIN